MFGGYDASASQFAGGGFMPSQMDAGNKPGVSPAPQKSKTGHQTLRALTVKQIHEATSNASDDVHMLDGEEVQDVTLVGKIVSIQQGNVSLSIWLDDSTGKIDVRHWLEEEGDMQQQVMSEWQPGVYVRVHGHLRMFDGSINFQAFKIRPITDFNEVTYHLLSTIFQHLHLTKSKQQGGAAAFPSALGGGGTGLAPSYGGGMGGGTSYGAPSGCGMFNGMGGGFGGGGGAAGNMGGMATDGMSSCQKDVQTVMNMPDAQKDSGVSFEEIVNKLNNRYTRTQIRDAVEFLVNEGHMYNTIDDNHYKSTNC